MKRIILTGGGTAGHVTPNIALLPRLRELQYDIHYIGSYNGMEKQLVEQQGIPYHGISSGKLRRYFSLQNFTDPFRVLKGFSEANRLIKLDLPLPTYEMVLKASHTFNLLDARRAISVTERQRYILRVRTLARDVAQSYLQARARLGFPMATPELRDEVLAKLEAAQ